MQQHRYQHLLTGGKEILLAIWRNIPSNVKPGAWKISRRTMLEAFARMVASSSNLGDKACFNKSCMPSSKTKTKCFPCYCSWAPGKMFQNHLLESTFTDSFMYTQGFKTIGVYITQVSRFEKEDVVSDCVFHVGQQLYRSRLAFALPSSVSRESVCYGFLRKGRWRFLNAVKQGM